LHLERRGQGEERESLSLKLNLLNGLGERLGKKGWGEIWGRKSGGRIALVLSIGHGQVSTSERENGEKALGSS